MRDLFAESGSTIGQSKRFPRFQEGILVFWLIFALGDSKDPKMSPPRLPRLQGSLESPIDTPSTHSSERQRDIMDSSSERQRDIMDSSSERDEWDIAIMRER